MLIFLSFFVTAYSRLNKGHQSTKEKYPHVRSHHGTSPLQSPTSAAIAADNHSANLFNNNNNLSVTRNDIKSSQISLKSSVYTNFNDIYSNCYSSLRSLKTKSGHNETETDICSFVNSSLNETVKSNESIRPILSKPQSSWCTKNADPDNYFCHRSASCKDLHHEENFASGKLENVQILLNDQSKTKEARIEALKSKYKEAINQCYSSCANNNAAVEYTSNYSGFAETRSGEFFESGLDEPLAEVTSLKYDSQEDIVLSHDDISHDSYELLERELDVFGEELMRNKNKKVLNESERARSCSWGSDKGGVSFDSRSIENIIGSNHRISTENGFWTLEKDKRVIHKSEADFRSLDRKRFKGPTVYKEKEEFKIGKKFPSTFERPIQCPIGDVVSNYKSELKFVGKECNLTSERDTWTSKKEKSVKGENFGNREVFQFKVRRKSFEEFEAHFENQNEFVKKEKQNRLEERKRVERKRDKKEREERFHEGIKEKEERDWEREKERRQIERKRNLEEKQKRREETEKEALNKLATNDYANFQEIHFKKFDRVVSNKFGQYPEFLNPPDNLDESASERKVMENYEKVCQVGRIAKEIEKSKRMVTLDGNAKNGIPKNFFENIIDRKEIESRRSTSQSRDVTEGFNNAYSSKKKSKFEKSLVERTKSDPYNSNKNIKRNVLMHQKSIDLTSQQSEERISDYDNENEFKKTSKSEHDIPYVLHKRQCMNGTAKNNHSSSHSPRVLDIKENEGKSPSKTLFEVTDTLEKSKSLDFQLDNSVAGFNVCELESIEKTTKNFEKKIGKYLIADLNSNPSKIVASKPPIGKKPGLFHENKIDFTDHEKESRIDDSTVIENFHKNSKNKEPIYAEVYKGQIIDIEIPPKPPKRITSIEKKFSCSEERKKTSEHNLHLTQKNSFVESKKLLTKDKEGKEDKVADKVNSMIESKNSCSQSTDSAITKSDLEFQKSKDLSLSSGTSVSSVHSRREECLTLFARTRLGMSEGSAFPSISKAGHGSPTSQRRTKSLDAPYVSVNRLPPANAFSSKDDTLEGNENDLIIIRAKEHFKNDLKPMNRDSEISKSLTSDTSREISLISESEPDIAEGIELEKNFRVSVENQSKVDFPYEEKILDGMRNKRLLSKIESIDGIDSEGDMDSSKQTDVPPIPSDRLVNLPEFVRFPSARQTSEESADGWEQKEVKVKRRTPRRSVGREEPDTSVKESVVWGSRDDEPPDDDVWDDNLVFGEKLNGSLVLDPIVPGEYLKRGSCGQSIDDDNLSTPMKESSPEHWVSVDDLPEALEREEKLLKQQEKILREKILNEKLKRELNLDTIDVDEKYYEYRELIQGDYVGHQFKGQSLDTYELTEKKLRERGTNKNSSLDERVLNENQLKKFLHVPLDFDDSLSNLQYIHCKGVGDLMEIDQFDQDNDEELEEFFVVLDENSSCEREGEHHFWGGSDDFKRTVSKEESLISVPDEFKDIIEEYDQLKETPGSSREKQKNYDKISDKIIEIRLTETENKGITERNSKYLGKVSSENEDSNEKLSEVKEMKIQTLPVLERSGSEEQNKVILSDDTGRLSPYDFSSRRGSDDPRRISFSEEATRLSPYADSRRGSDDPRRLSTSEDSRKCSMSESVSEETRRRLSSTEETRRKRASLTKQCSVGADSLSDEMITGIQECSSSFEQDDDKDVFETEPTKTLLDKGDTSCSNPNNDSVTKDLLGNRGASDYGKNLLEIKVSENITISKEVYDKKILNLKAKTYLVPPATERELSRETEDSVDYCEEDFKDIREAVKEKDMSEELSNKHREINFKSSLKPTEENKSMEGEELQYIDEKKEEALEIIVGSSKEAVSTSVVVVYEGIAVLNKIMEKNRMTERSSRSHSLSRERETSISVKPQTKNTKFHTLPKDFSEGGANEKVHKKLTKVVPNINSAQICSGLQRDSFGEAKKSFDSSQESDLDKLSEISVVSHVQSQIAKRNLYQMGKHLKHDEGLTEYCKGLPHSKVLEKDEDAVKQELALVKNHFSSEKRIDKNMEFKTINDGNDCLVPLIPEIDKPLNNKTIFEEEKLYLSVKDKRSPDQEKKDSGEDGSSSSSAPQPKRELSSTWKPFLLESSGSSSLEEGWLPPDDNAHLADEEETSSTSNNQQDDSCHDDIDYPTGIGYPVLNVFSGEMAVGGFSNVYALSRTLSRISERSTSEQERSNAEDDFTKPSSHSVSVEEESLLSSDRQPSLSSDPPSPRDSYPKIPDLPDDMRDASQDNEKREVIEPFLDIIPPPLTEEEWPSPSSSSSIIDTPVVSHIETVYLEIFPEEAHKVVVSERQNDENGSSDENQTLHEENDSFYLPNENASLSTTTTTQNETVVIPPRRRNARTGSVSEDGSLMSTSDWSNSNNSKSRSNSNFGVGDDIFDWSRSAPMKENIIKPYHTTNDDISECILLRKTNSADEITDTRIDRHAESQHKLQLEKCSPQKLRSPPGKVLGFFETPVSKVQSPTSQSRFFQTDEPLIGCSVSVLMSPTSHSETTSPKHHWKSFENPGCRSLLSFEKFEKNPPTAWRMVSETTIKPETKTRRRGSCTPYYSNVADKAEKSYFGRYDTGSLERRKIQSSRKCSSYFSMSKTVPDEGEGSAGTELIIQSSNTIPRATKKTKKRHRVAMDLEIRDGRIVAPPKTRATVLENSDSDRSSPPDSNSGRIKKRGV